MVTGGRGKKKKKEKKRRGPRARDVTCNNPIRGRKGEVHGVHGGRRAIKEIRPTEGGRRERVLADLGGLVW